MIDFFLLCIYVRCADICRNLSNVNACQVYQIKSKVHCELDVEPNRQVVNTLPQSFDHIALRGYHYKLTEALVGLLGVDNSRCREVFI